MVTDLLGERRNRMRTKLQHILFNGSTGAGVDESSSCTCAWGAVHSFAHTELLQHENLRPLQILDVTVSKVVERMEQMRDPLMLKQWEHCDHRWHREPRYRATRGVRLHGFCERNRLCIDCVRYGTTTTNQIHRNKGCVTNQGRTLWEH
jgi:hypothetical protein